MHYHLWIRPHTGILTICDVFPLEQHWGVKTGMVRQYSLPTSHGDPCLRPMELRACTVLNYWLADLRKVLQGPDVLLESLMLPTLKPNPALLQEWQPFFRGRS